MYVSVYLSFILPTLFSSIMAGTGYSLPIENSNIIHLAMNAREISAEF